MKYTNGHAMSYLANSLRTLSPAARALVRGNAEHPALEGFVTFYRSGAGVVVAAEFKGLPASGEACAVEVFGFHIHEGTSCTGNAEDPFADAGGHYNPGDCPHPAHAGDLPPLFGNNGFAWQTVFTDRFTIQEVLGRAVVVHSMPDDFTTQPAGNSGERIACGIIMAMK